jgi:protein-tyrosine-phosphatase
VTRVLFVCVKNGGKSQMAAGLFRHAVTVDANPGRWQVESAGTKAGTKLNGLSVESLAGVGIDITGELPTPWTDEFVRAADAVVTMGCGDAGPSTPRRTGPYARRLRSLQGRPAASPPRPAGCKRSKALRRSCRTDDFCRQGASRDFGFADPGQGACRHRYGSNLYGIVNFDVKESLPSSNVPASPATDDRTSR